MATLLEKTRKINKLLQSSENVKYDDMAVTLRNVLDANVYIADNEGTICGYSLLNDFECDLMIDKVINVGKFPRHYVNWLRKMETTSANLQTKSGLCAFNEEDTDCLFGGKTTTVVPIYGAGQRIGALIAARFDEKFDDDDLLLAEYGATVVGMEMLRRQLKDAELASSRRELENSKREAAKLAITTLSFSEMKAAVEILEELKRTNDDIDNEQDEQKRREKEKKRNIVIASSISKKCTITRSVIVNALRKFESAGVIESKSLGMRGTHIKVLNEYLMDEIKKLQH